MSSSSYSFRIETALEKTNDAVINKERNMRVNRLFPARGSLLRAHKNLYLARGQSSLLEVSEGEIFFSCVTFRLMRPDISSSFMAA